MISTLAHVTWQGIYPTILVVLLRLQQLSPHAGMLSQGIINQDLSKFAAATGPLAIGTHSSIVRPRTHRNFGTFNTVTSVDLGDVERESQRDSDDSGRRSDDE